MIEEYNQDQNIACNMIINSVKKNKISHAYLIETNNYSYAFNLVKAFAKLLLCPNSYTNDSSCNDCYQCRNIDANEFLELKIIESEGQWIKKNQLDELQEEFSKKSVIGNRKVYIIKDAGKLNEASSNSLLKFLEEPEEGIIAILMVNNRTELLNTIVSRCQLISLKNNISKYTSNNVVSNIAYFLYNNEDEINDFINNENSIILIKNVLKFVISLENSYTNTLLNIKSLWHDNFDDKQKIYLGLNIMILFYKDVLNKMLNRNKDVFIENDNELDIVIKTNNENLITKKIEILMDTSNKIKYNINSNMLMDKLIIDFKEVVCQ